MTDSSIHHTCRQHLTETFQSSKQAQQSHWSLCSSAPSCTIIYGHRVHKPASDRRPLFSVQEANRFCLLSAAFLAFSPSTIRHPTWLLSPSSVLRRASSASPSSSRSTNIESVTSAGQSPHTCLQCSSPFPLWAASSLTTPAASAQPPKSSSRSISSPRSRPPTSCRRWCSPSRPLSSRTLRSRPTLRTCASRTTRLSPMRTTHSTQSWPTSTSSSFRIPWRARSRFTARSSRATSRWWRSEKHLASSRFSGRCRSVWSPRTRWRSCRWWSDGAISKSWRRCWWTTNLKASSSASWRRACEGRTKQTSWRCCWRTFTSWLHETERTRRRRSWHPSRRRLWMRCRISSALRMRRRWNVWWRLELLFASSECF